jgi:hypothetical protein
MIIYVSNKYRHGQEEKEEEEEEEDEKEVKQKAKKRVELGELLAVCIHTHCIHSIEMSIVEYRNTTTTTSTT